MRLIERRREWRPGGAHRAPDEGVRARPRWTAVGLVAPFLVAGGLLLGFRVAREGTLPHLAVDGVPVGSMTEAEVRAVVRSLALRRGAEEVTVRRDAVGRTPPASLTSPAADLGYQLDVEATVRALLERGRQANPLAALLDHLVATFATVEVHPVQGLDEATFGGWVREAVGRLSVPAAEGGLRFIGTAVQPVYPRPGAAVDEAALRARARAAVLSPGPDSFVVPTSPLPPRTTAEQVDRVLSRARLALSGPVTLRSGPGSVTLTPEQVALVLGTEVVERPAGPRLRLVADPGRLRRVLGDEVARLESPPVDATFAVVGGTVQVVPSRDGVAFDPQEAARKLVRAALRDDRTATLRGRPVEPELTTEEARSLRIDELVSTFTTYHPCCQPRVHNIHLIADLVDGHVVMPGEVFSLNEFVGERTPEKGFVLAPGITNGEFVDQYGGGISQFTTTMFNAVFFGGYEILEFQPHSYWFSRYPMGREATLSWPHPDLRFRNDTDAGIYIDTSYTDTSVTVTFYGHTDVEVSSTTGRPYDVVPPPVECRPNPSLAKGEEVVVQEGIQGFTVKVTRTLRYPDGREETEVYTTRYRALPTIVERRTCKGSEAGTGA
jgi:vancomycin resistance protein YoaR